MRANQHKEYSLSTPKLIDQMDYKDIKLHEEEPFCPQCGSMCTLKSRAGTWECCDYSITVQMWDIVRQHAGLLEKILDASGIKYITYHDVPIEVSHAVSPSHLLCLFLIQAEDMGAAVGIQPLLKVEPISEDVDTESVLMPYTINVNTNGCMPHVSLLLLSSAARVAVDNLREVDESGGTLDHKYIFPVSTNLLATE